MISSIPTHHKESTKEAVSRFRRDELCIPPYSYHCHCEPPPGGVAVSKEAVSMVDK